jgi:hypothetical protein
MHHSDGSENGSQLTGKPEVISLGRKTGLSDKWLPPLTPLRPSQRAHNRRCARRAKPSWKRASACSRQRRKRTCRKAAIGRACCFNFYPRVKTSVTSRIRYSRREDQSFCAHISGPKQGICLLWCCCFRHAAIAQSRKVEAMPSPERYGSDDIDHVTFGHNRRLLIPVLASLSLPTIELQEICGLPPLKEPF